MRSSFTKTWLAAASLFVCGSLFAQQAHIGAASYPTIQQAINAAAPGSLITLDAGVFTENVVINKPVTIQGAGQAHTTIYPAISGPACGVAASICPGSSNVMLVQAHNVTIRGLTIDGDNPSLTSGVVRSGKDINARNGIITNHSAGKFNNLVVDHVTVKNIYLRGIYASSGGTFSFTHNTASNVRGEYASIAIMNYGGAGSFLNNTVDNANDGIVSNWSQGSVYKFNTVTNSSSGIHSDNNQALGDVIEHNTVTNSSADGYGIWIFSPFVSAIVNANTITNVDVALANSGQAVPAAFPVFSNNVIDGQNKLNSVGVYQTNVRWGFGTTHVNGKYEGNVISNTDYTFYVELSAAKQHKIIAKFNSITGNTYNVVKAPAAGATLTSEFTCNWWGSNAPAVFGATIDASISYTPWLTSGSDNSPAAGFQPAALCNGSMADLDGDGVLNAADCDPLDPSIGAASHVYYADTDGDGFGDPANSITVCSSTVPAGYVTNNYDSDDTDGKALIWVCHKGNGIVVKANSLPAHLAHGDVAGSCSPQRTSRKAKATETLACGLYPNPARSEVHLSYQVRTKAQVSITIYDVLGRKTGDVFNGSREPGSYQLTHPVNKLIPGVYYLRVEMSDNENTIVQNMRFVKVK